MEQVREWSCSRVRGTESLVFGYKCNFLKHKDHQSKLTKVTTRFTIGKLELTDYTAMPHNVSTLSPSSDKLKTFSELVQRTDVKISGCKKICKIFCHTTRNINILRKRLANKASLGELRFLRFKNWQKPMALKKL